MDEPIFLSVNRNSKTGRAVKSQLRGEVTISVVIHFKYLSIFVVDLFS